MANYNANAMAAYQQYGQTMIAGGGGSNMSGTGSSTMQVFNAINDDNDDRPSGLGARPTTSTTEDKKPSFWDKITSVFQQNEVDVTNVYKPSVDPSQLYTQEMFEMVPSASDYVYRAEMSEQTQDMVEQAMGYEKPQLGQLQLLDTGAMTQEEKDRLGPLIDLADDIRNQNITTTELPPVEGEEQSSLMDALMEGQPTAGLMSRPSSFTGGSVQVASNIPNWMQDMSAAELTDALVGIKEGTVDPETGQPIQSAEDVAESNAPTREELISSVFKAEGGYSTDTEDSGNYYKGKFVGTNHGISAPVLAEHLGRTPTVAEMKALTKEEAKEIASQRYYDRFEIDTLPSDVQEIVFHAVYMGESRGVRAMQNLMGLTPDGKLGPKTKAAMKNADFTPQEFRDEFLRELQFGTEGYSDPSPSWNAHGRGWTNRYNKLAK